MENVLAPEALAQLPALDTDYPLTPEQVRGFWENGFIVLKSVLSPDEVAAYEKVIQEVAMAQFQANGMKLSFGTAFLQRTNLRYDDEGVLKFCLSRRLASIAGQLLEVKNVRIYHDQALFKPPGGSDSYWHQDQFYWPLNTERALGLWMPLVDCTPEMGGMRYARGSHRFGNLGQHDITQESEGFFNDFIEENNLEMYQVPALQAGDCTFHAGWTVHGALANKLLEASVVLYLEVPPKILAQRLHRAAASRPLLAAAADPAALSQRIYETLQARKQFYDRAPLRCLAPACTVASVRRLLDQYASTA